MPRFVVLLHETPHDLHRPAHWDLMLEDGDSLATWALEHEPGPSRTMAAELLPPHRLQYLDYEGPISGDRGIVTRWDNGSFAWKSRDEQRVVVLMTGTKLNGMAMLRQQNGRWHFSLETGPTGRDGTEAVDPN